MRENFGLASMGTQQHILDSIPVVVFEYTIANNGSRDFTYLSSRCEEVLGISKEVFLSGVHAMPDFVYEEDWQPLETCIEQSARDLTEFAWEGRLIVSEKTLWVEVVGTPHRHDDNSIVCKGVILNISKRKQSENRERDAELRYKNLVEALPLGIGVHAKGKLLYVNQYAAEMLGAKKPSELIGKEVINLVHPDYRSVVMDRIKLVLNGETVPAIEEKYIRLDGSVVEVESSGIRINFNGEIAVQNIARDITEKKEAETTIKQTEKLFSQLFENSPLAIVMLSATGMVVRSNHAFEEMFGYTFGEVSDRNLNGFIVPQELASEGTNLDDLISSNSVIKHETIRVTKDKKTLSVIIYGVPVNLEDTTIGIFGVYVDITERQKMEAELRIRNAELDNFVYKVSHDLRAPLSSILGLVNLASMPDNTDTLDEYIRIIGSKAEQLDRFIADVLSHSKNLKLDLKVSRIDFKEMLEESFLALKYLPGADQIVSKIKITDGVFSSDSWRIKEIFRNLISNAIKYRDQKRDISIVDINIKIREDDALIVFKDNGVGIEAENRDKIFEMFYRASELSDGSGLGLYIVKNAIEKLGGSIEMDSDPEIGTEFRVSLPNITA